MRERKRQLGGFIVPDAWRVRRPVRRFTDEPLSVFAMAMAPTAEMAATQYVLNLRAEPRRRSFGGGVLPTTTALAPWARRGRGVLN